MENNRYLSWLYVISVLELMRNAMLLAGLRRREEKKALLNKGNI